MQLILPSHQHCWLQLYCQAAPERRYMFMKKYLKQVNADVTVNTFKSVTVIVDTISQ